MLIRPEQEGDIAQIHALTKAAFADHPHSDGSEPLIIERLRAASALTLSWVVEHQGEVIAHLALSPVSWCDEPGWYGLGPVSVHPDHQGRGIGSSLIRASLDYIALGPSAGVVVLGPPDYYDRFGFKPDPRLTYPGPPADYFRVLAYRPVPQKSGPISYHPAFG